MTEAEKAAALAEASSIVTPYDQIKEDFTLDGGQYDFAVIKLEPTIDDRNGLYAIVIGVQATAPVTTKAERTLYVGTKKDPLAKLPETRLNSPALRFLKKIAKVNNVPTNAQSDAALCAALRGKTFGCRVEETTFTNKMGGTSKGWDFGRDVVPAGSLPARLDKQPMATSAPAAPAAKFASE